jgi:hypothetical protein
MNKKENLALCFDNEGYPASLEVGKLYRVIPDDEAAAHGYIRIIDESGEDYAYTASRFHLVQLPGAVEKALLSATSRTWAPFPLSDLSSFGQF